MKKILLGMSVGAMLFAGPASTAVAGGGPPASILNLDIYDFLDDAGEFENFLDLLDVAGYDELLEVPDNDVLGSLCSNGGPMFTVFAPIDLDGKGSPQGVWREALEDLLDKSWAQILATPGLAKAIVDDHIVNNSVSIAEMQNPTLQQLVARSGFLISITSPTGETRYVNDEDGYPNVSAAGRSIIGATQLCNGHVYGILQPFSSTKKVTTEGLGPEDSPKDGTPGGTSSLPNTL